MLELKYDYHSIEAGCDEAGRGCLAGPVFAAAVILPDNFSDELLRDIPHLCIVKGDGKYMSIAAASVLAKTHRDEYMENLHALFPVYNWKKNKGYPTQEHRKGIEQAGVTEFHRISFTLLDPQLKIQF